MRLGLQLSYTNGIRDVADEIIDLEAAGLQLVSVPEAYSFDSVSQLGYLAAVTERLELSSGIMQVLTRTPALVAMTAASLDHASAGRFSLGIGASGPQVIEGFHGASYERPLTRLREIIEICRVVWRRERLEHSGSYYTVPLSSGFGTDVGKALKLVNEPLRERIPITVAAIGPRSVRMAAEVAEGWEPAFFFPERARQVWGASLDSGLAKRAPGLGPLDIVASAPCAIGEGLDTVPASSREQLALYLGGMGTQSENFYRELAIRYGFADAATEIQEHYLAGRKRAAEAAVPDELIAGTSLVGAPERVAERLSALREAGVTTLKIALPQTDRRDRRRTVETLRGMIDAL